MVLAAAVAVVLLASAVHGVVGFGLNLVAVPVLLLLDASYVPGPALAAGLVLALLMVGRELPALDRRLGWAVLGLLPGTALGLLLLTAVAPDRLGVPLGVLVLVAVGLSALRWRPFPTRRALAFAGTVSGLLATSTSIGGPPMALLYAGSSGAELRSTLSAFFVAVDLLALVALGATGELGAHEAAVSAAFLPAVVAGFLLSGPLRPLVDRGRTRPAVLAVSALAAVGVVLQGLLA